MSAKGTILGKGHTHWVSTIPGQEEKFTFMIPNQFSWTSIYGASPWATCEGQSPEYRNGQSTPLVFDELLWQRGRLAHKGSIS